MRFVQRPRDAVLSQPLLSWAERRQAGKDLRKQVPRGSHAAWSPPRQRPDPVRTVIDSGRHRIAALLPIRHDRMLQSPFAFLRGSAAIMAGDLAATPSSGSIGTSACPNRRAIARLCG